MHKQRVQIQLVFCFLVVACVWISAAVMPQGGTSIPWKTPDYTLIARQMPLREALTSFGAAQGLPVILSDDVEGVLSGDFRALPAQEFLERVTVMNNLTWFYDGAALYISTGSENQTMLLDLKYMKAAEVRAMLKELGVEDVRFPLKTTSNDELLLVSGPPRYVLLVADLIARADKLRENRATSQIETRIFYLRHTWADDVSINVSSAESSVQIKGVTKLLEDLMNQNHGMPAKDSVADKDGTDKAKDSAEEEMDAVVKQLDRSFKPIFRAENRLNAVVIRDVARNMPLYEKLIAQLDVPQKLVEIAVTSLELSKDDALDWQLSLSVSGGKDHIKAGGGQGAPSVFAPEELIGKGLSGALTYVDRHVNIAASLTALREKGKARNISRATLLTMNNMAAVVSDTQSYHTKVVGSEVASLETVSAGTKLQLKPRIVESTVKDIPSQLWMTLALEDGGFETIAVDSMPLTRTTSLTTQTAVYEGQSVVLAGYLRDIEESVGWGIPYLRDIPYIGWLFGGMSRKSETVQRMFLLTPHIIDLNDSALARKQSVRLRDISNEEQLEDDVKDVDNIREYRQLDREYQDDIREKNHSLRMDTRKRELKIERDRLNVNEKEIREDVNRQLDDREKDWKDEKEERKETREKAAEAEKAEKAARAEAEKAEKAAREEAEKAEKAAREEAEKAARKDSEAGVAKADESTGTAENAQTGNRALDYLHHQEAVEKKAAEK